MADDHKEDVQEDMHPSDGSYSRRQFMKIAGIAGATVGLGAGLGGVLAACGGEKTTTTTAAAATTTSVAAETTTSVAAETTTSVSAGPEAGREIKIGNPLPETGVLASFGAYEKWADGFSQKALGDGMVCFGTAVATCAATQR